MRWCHTSDRVIDHLQLNLEKNQWLLLRVFTSINCVNNDYLICTIFLERDHSVYNLFLLLNFSIQHESKTGEQEIVNLKIPPRQEKKKAFLRGGHGSYTMA